MAVASPQSLELRPDGIILVHMRGEIDDDNFDRFCDEMDQFYAPLSSPFAIVIDASMLSFVSARRRKRLADLDLKYREKDLRFNRGQAFVVRSPIVRGAVTALQWVVKAPYPVRVVETMEDGLAWAKARLASGVQS